jgi:hypothetical protein
MTEQQLYLWNSWDWVICGEGSAAMAATFEDKQDSGALF